ncbi:102_t:CDS:1, partial [Acaulospora morrowiae]
HATPQQQEEKVEKDETNMSENYIEQNNTISQTKDEQQIFEITM